MNFNLKPGQRPVVTPHVLVLEGLWSDTGEALRAAGAKVTEGHPWDARYVEDLADGHFDALVLTGGSDIDPRLYTDDAKHPSVYGIDHTRDLNEWEALGHALEQGIPVLGICRGSQIMTAFRGGRLCQHIGEEHRGTDHIVYAAPEARCFRGAIQAREMDVVSLHHQCVVEAGPGMRIAAYAPDGTPEAVESIDGLWLGCQFHPELAAFKNLEAYNIFRWLVGKAAERAGGRAQSDPFRTVRRLGSQAYRDWSADKEEEAFGSGWDTQAWRDDYEDDDFDDRLDDAYLPPRNKRKAGEPSLPSMRTARDIRAGIAEALDDLSFEDYAEEVDGVYVGDIDTAGLLICPLCAMQFDHAGDRHDHARIIHGYTVMQDELDYIEPPEGHEAWEPRRVLEATNNGPFSSGMDPVNIH